MSHGATLAICLGIYALLVLAVGVLSTRKSARSSEEYFLAGRTLGTLILFMALFGTNCTAFVLVGIPGRAYHDGIGIFGVNVPIIALGIPLTFYAIGSPAHRMAVRLKALTPAELYARRFGSPQVGVVLFVAYTFYTVPYMVTAIKGAAVTLHAISNEGVSFALAGAAVTAVAVLYTALGGMRATAWTNVLQGLLFMSFMVAAFFLIAGSMGGLSEAMAKVQRHDPDLLIVREDRGRYFPPAAWASWGMAITFTVIGFPHMLARLMAAKDDGSIRSICRLYPLAMGLLWIPAVMLGVWGQAEFPGLIGKESDLIFSKMVEAHLPPWLGAVGLLAVLAAVMSTLDAQLLTLSSMLVRDVLARFVPGSGKRDVAAGRGFMVMIAATVYGLTLTWGDSVFKIAVFAFSGYVTLTPALFLGVRWKRFTATGAIASIFVGYEILAVLHFGGHQPLGFLPVLWAFVGATLAGVLVSLATKPASPSLVEQAFE